MSSSVKKKIKNSTTTKIISTDIPPRLNAYVTETQKDTKRYVMIGLLSFVFTVLVVFFSPQFLHFVSTIKNTSFFSKMLAFPKLSKTTEKSVNLDKIFLSGGEQTVDPLLVKNSIDERDETWIFVDYRSPAEYQASHIKGAINIPLYTDFKKYTETTVPLSTWYESYWKIQKWGKKVLVYGYWDKAQLSQDLKNFLNKRGERCYFLTLGFYEFKTNFYQWVPGGDMNDTMIANYLEGSLVGPAGP